jgi:hypothetical protein
MQISPTLGENVLLSEIAKEIDSQSRFIIPPHNDIQIQYVSGTDKPSYMTFRLNGTEVYWLMFSYDESMNLTRIQPD